MLRLAVVASLVLCGIARAEPGLIVGVTDDTLQWTPTETAAIGRDLGLRAYMLTLPWDGGQSSVSPNAVASLSTGVSAAGAARVVLSVYGRASSAPTTPEAREWFCSFARDAIARFPQVNDVVIWNEPNLAYFWQPQFGQDGASAAPAAYEALLARCWDVLHALRPGVNVVAPATSPGGNDDPLGTSNVSHSPTSFLLKLGAAYRASGRTKPIFDILGHHPYPAFSTERPWRTHSSDRVISVGDIDRLVGAARQAFSGTAQPVPGGGLPIWYLETGYQTIPDESKRSFYYGIEDWPGLLPDGPGGEPDRPQPSTDSLAPDQATQLLDSLRVIYCQPYVQAVFNFVLRDEADLGKWQSGVLWADGTRKRSYGAFRRAIAEIANRSIDCTRLKGSIWPDEASGTTSPPAVGEEKSKSVDGRIPMRLVWAAPNPAPFGYARLAVRLTDGRRGLAGRYLSFGVGESIVVARTGKGGLARASVAPPLPPGAHVLTTSFQGDTAHQPTGLKQLLRVTNSRASIWSGEPGRKPSGLQNGFFVRFDGGSVTGWLRVRVGGRLVQARRLNALGVAADGTSAWFAGVAGNGARIVGNVERASRRRGGVLRLRLAGRQLPPVRGLDMKIARSGAGR
jgi:hypothetical protein